ncbi:hypothetical protein J437_LFUL008506 [Ladona fulva]|uniref:Uncharacterized protein n=1 Tax=Ladona fulva TaxID=123851 RepID=A0A8K0K3M3_LADFU|nr:hypothetical protein J437_LFUL008506 [Ladona fulva]
MKTRGLYYQDIVVSIICELLSAVIAHSQILVTESGVMPIRRGDTGITFWLTVMNLKYDALNISAQMCRCCEVLSDTDTECNHMKLIPSRTERLNGRGTRNLTLIYPTLYPHQRRGTCQVDVKSVLAAAPNYVHRSKRNCPPAAETATYEDSSSSDFTPCIQPRHINFDTRVSLTSLPPLLSNYYDISEVQWKLFEDLNTSPNPSIEVCESSDLDPLDKCSPVDCAIKYAGTRSFFDRESKRCLQVPSCLSHEDAALPNKPVALTGAISGLKIVNWATLVSCQICRKLMKYSEEWSYRRLDFYISYTLMPRYLYSQAYIPISNQCRDMEHGIEMEDVTFLKYGEPSKRKRSSVEQVPTKLRCHNGKEDPNTGICVCDEGWGTYSIEEDKREPPLPVLSYQEDSSNTPLHMCTVKDIQGGPHFFLATQDLAKTMELVPGTTDKSAIVSAADTKNGNTMYNVR